MTLLIVAWIVIAVWMMIGEAYYERDWPRHTFPAFAWGVGLLIMFTQGVN